MNHGIVDVNKIYEGHTIILPAAAAGTLAVESSPVIGSAVAVLPVQEPAAPQAPSPLKVETKATIELSPAARLAVIKQIITKMNGIMMTREITIYLFPTLSSSPSTAPRYR